MSRFACVLRSLFLNPAGHGNRQGHGLRTIFNLTNYYVLINCIFFNIEINILTINNVVTNDKTIRKVKK